MVHNSALHENPAYQAVKENESEALVRARRTAFVARFIVLRESKRSRSHRLIEQLEWQDLTTAEELHDRFRCIFLENGDTMEPVDRDLRRALAHSQRSINHFIQEYAARSTLNFVDALYDYERSNELLFGEDEHPKLGGWRLPQELERQRQCYQAATKPNSSQK